MTLRTLFAALLLLLPLKALADADTLIPKDRQSPDRSVLSLEEMSVSIVIDNGDAHVRITQIFLNHTNEIQEGTYRFALPSGSTVSDFAVWDGPVRIPAVILERRRADQVYATARSQAIDPGLLQMGERDDSDPRSTALFTAKIVPIAPYATKRLELEYHQRLTATDFKQLFTLALKPDQGQQQTAHHFKLDFKLLSAHAFTGLKASGLSFAVADPHSAEASTEETDLTFADDFTASWQLTPEALDKLEVITHRNPAPPLPTAGETAPTKSSAPEPGFFAAQLLVANPASAVATVSAPHTIVLLFDNSLSMQWDKLERSYAALEATLAVLHPGDHFNLLLFNQTVTPFRPAVVPADAAVVKQALEFVRASKLRGGTDLGKALAAGLAQCAGAGNATLALFTDGGSNRGESVLPAKIAAQYAARWKQAQHPPHTAVFAVGDDANLPLLRSLAHNDGFLEPVLSTEPAEFHIQSFVSRLSRTPVAGLALAAPGAQLVYPLDDAVYPGSIAQWVGQYQPSNKPMAVTASGTRGSQPFSAHAETPLPAVDPAHPQLPRLWAQARVDALLAQIDRDGESAALIDEILRLSRRYKFVTPYTSFLAVPRSLLRPRVIRPGDPVLRVRTDAQITSVIALFPFGLTQPLRHLATEDLHAPGDEANRLWETRFLAPMDMKDGTYNVRLILRDTHGNTYNEAKTFVIASTPPAVKLDLKRTQLHRGEALEIRASATQSTRTLTARIDGLAPTTLRWSPRALTNTGTLVIPAGLPVGRYTLTVTAEDVAHNLGSQEAQIDVIP